MLPDTTRRTRLICVAVLVAVGGCSASEQPPDDSAPAANTLVTVCLGPSEAYAAGDMADLELTSRGDVLATGSLRVPGELVLTIPASAPEPRLLVDGVEWASSPRGGGWGVSRGDGCPLG